MASSATSATSFELIEDQTLTVEEVEMASQEAQDIRKREAAVAAGLVLDEPEAPPSASATDVMKDLSSALERLRVAFATPTSGLGAPGPAEEGDKDMGDADGTERATPPEEAQTPPTKRLKGFVAASQKATSQANKPVSFVPVDGKPGYFKLVDLPDLFPVLPASAATLLRDITVEEAVSLFHKFVGKKSHGGPGDSHPGGVCPDEDPAPPGGGLGFTVPEEQGVCRHCTGSTQVVPITRHAERGGQRQPSSAGSAPARSSPPSRHPRHYEADGITYNLLIVEGKPTWIQQPEWGSLGAVGPGGTRAQADRNLVDGTVLGRAPPKTDTADEITIADAVPLNRRVDIRQEILSMEADDEALKVRESQEIKVKVALPPPGGPGDQEEGRAA